MGGAESPVRISSVGPLPLLMCSRDSRQATYQVDADSCYPSFSHDCPTAPVAAVPALQLSVNAAQAKQPTAAVTCLLELCCSSKALCC